MLSSSGSISSQSWYPMAEETSVHSAKWSFQVKSELAQASQTAGIEKLSVLKNQATSWTFPGICHHYIAFKTDVTRKEGEQSHIACMTWGKSLCYPLRYLRRGEQFCK